VLVWVLAFSGLKIETWGTQTKQPVNMP